MRVLVAMSGGVDSSVAAALLRDEGHEVVGVTMRLWGGPSDSGCCSVSDVDDARRVAQQLDVEHLVFNFSEDFDRQVVGPYVDDHVRGLTPNPCIECNRHLKFSRLLDRALALGFDAIATGHHARIERTASGPRLARAADRAKDQSYVLHMLDATCLERLLLPIGEMTKDEVRARATALGLRTATKPDSQDVCFIARSDGGRSTFLGDRIPLHPAEVVDAEGNRLGGVEAVELVTIGQRRGLGVGIDGRARYAVEVDVPGRRIRVGEVGELDVDGERLDSVIWVDAAARAQALAAEGLVGQTSAHGAVVPIASIAAVDGGVDVSWARPTRRVAPGQSVVVYAGEVVLGGGIVTRR
ncbi:MAG: tRNA 2-thiouridine(34) synthase MnmA [Acidimicrobiia bacterium]|nr:tRNA 2-thiouridine(34) synthase MnmA [Acidimicrobiia bacterium]